MGQFLRDFGLFRFLLIVSTIYVTATIYQEDGQEESNSQEGLLRRGRKNSARPIVRPSKLPRILRRKYEEWVVDPKNVTALFHSIPLEVQHIKDDLFQMSAPYRNSKLKLLKVQLWMEFPSITKSNKPKHHEYLVEVTPAMGSGHRVGYDDDCSPVTVVTKRRFPETILEMKFDITSLYRSCKDRDNYEYFRLKLRLYSFEDDCDIDMTKDAPDAFLVFREFDELEDLMEVIPDAEPLHRDSIMMKLPQTRALGWGRPRNKHTKPCSLRPYEFRFIDSGWATNVFYPDKYKSNMCRGRCSFPFPDHLNATNYAIIRSLASSMYRNVNNPSCVAQDLAPLTMIVHDEDRITLKVQKNMIALNCRCA